MSITVNFTHEVRYQGVAVGEANATAHIEVGPQDWTITRITLRSLDDNHDVDMLQADFLAEKTALYMSKQYRTFREDVEEAAQDERNGRYVYDREMARAG